jgi:hypothetical protein
LKKPSTTNSTNTPGCAKNAEDASERTATEFVLKLLKKRLFSSPAAFHDTLQKHQQTLAGLSEAAPARRPSERHLARQDWRWRKSTADDDAMKKSRPPPPSPPRRR